MGKLSPQATDEVNIKINTMLNDFRNKKLTVLSQALRKNMTDEERKLWYECLKLLPWQFRRQKIIVNYIVDFYCAEKKTAIEIDGSQHYEEDNIRKDNERTEFLIGKGITVLRYSNLDINTRFEDVCADIFNRLSAM